MFLIILDARLRGHDGLNNYQNWIDYVGNGPEKIMKETIPVEKTHKGYLPDDPDMPAVAGLVCKELDEMWRVNEMPRVGERL